MPAEPVPIKLIEDAIRVASLAPSGANQQPWRFVVVRDPEIKRQIRENVTPHHVPRKIVQVADIPRTISGKIAELAVRDVVHGRTVKNREALANPDALEVFRDLPELRR